MASKQINRSSVFGEDGTKGSGVISNRQPTPSRSLVWLALNRQSELAPQLPQHHHGKKRNRFPISYPILHVDVLYPKVASISFPIQAANQLAKSQPPPDFLLGGGEDNLLISNCMHLAFPSDEVSKQI